MTARLTRESLHVLVETASEPEATARLTREAVHVLVETASEPAATARLTRIATHLLLEAPDRLLTDPITASLSMTATLRAAGAPAASVNVTEISAQALILVPEGDVGVRVSQLVAEPLTIPTDTALDVSQVVAEPLSTPTDTAVRVSQVAAEVLLVPNFAELCPTFPVVFKLTIEGDGGDILTVTSYADGGALIAEAPRVDGQTFDPLTGKTTIGQANVLVIDATQQPCSDGGTYDYRYVTAILADANGNSQLLGKPAKIEIARDLTTLAYQPYFSGYITGVTLVDGTTYEISLAHTTRDDETTKVYATNESPSIYARSCWLGGSVTDSVPSPNTEVQRFEGYWQATVKGVYDTFVHVDVNEDNCDAFPPFDVRSYLDDDRWFVNLFNGNDAEQRNVFVWQRDRAQKYYLNGYPTQEAQTEWLANPTTKPPIYGYFPRLVAFVVEKNGNPFAYGAPVMASYSGQAYSGGGGAIVQLWENLGNHFYWYWPDADVAVNDVLTFYAAPLDVSEAAPVWLYGHPAEILRDALEESGVTVNAASVTAAITGVGDVNLSMRITEPQTIADLIALLCGAFGMGVRYEQDGSRSLFCWRSRTTPVATISLDDLITPASVWWKTEEQSRLFSLEWKFRRYATWPGDTSDATPGDRAFDGVSEIDETPVVFNSSNVQPVGSRTESYDVPGMLLTRNAVAGFDGKLLPNIVDICATWADQSFATFANGSIITEIEVFHELLNGTVPQIGDEVWLDLIARPGIDIAESPTSQRGLVERALCIANTPTPTGFQLTLMRVPETGAPPSSGTGITFPTPPALDTSFTPSKGTPATQYVDLDLDDDSNYANYAYIQVQYLVQNATPATSDAGTLWGIEWYPPGTFTIGPFPQGSKVWVRIRSVAPLNGVSAWTAWESVTLDTGTSVVPSGTVQLPSLGYDIDSITGDVDLTVQTGPEAVKVYAAASTSAFPDSATILAGSTDTVAPYSFNNITNVANGETAYLGAIAEDTLGNKSVPAYIAGARFDVLLDSISVQFVGGISANDIRDIQVPYACTVLGWSIFGTVSGSIVVDIWRDTVANFPPTVGDSIAGTGKPTVTTATYATGNTTGWGSTALAKDDILRFNVDSVTSFTQVTVSLTVQRT